MLFCLLALSVVAASSCPAYRPLDDTRRVHTLMPKQKIHIASEEKPPDLLVCPTESVRLQISTACSQNRARGRVKTQDVPACTGEATIVTLPPSRDLYIDVQQRAEETADSGSLGNDLEWVKYVIIVCVTLIAVVLSLIVVALVHLKERKEKRAKEASNVQPI